MVIERFVRIIKKLLLSNWKVVAHCLDRRHVDYGNFFVVNYSGCVKFTVVYQLEVCFTLFGSSSC